MALAKSLVEAVPPRSPVRRLPWFNTVSIAFRKWRAWSMRPTCSRSASGRRQAAARSGWARTLARPPISGAEPCTASKMAKLSRRCWRRAPRPGHLHQAGDQIGQNIAEQIRRHDHIELPGVQHELHGTRVHDPVVANEPALVFLAYVTRHASRNTPVSAFQHIGLVDDGDLLAAELQRVLRTRSARPFCGNPHTGIHAGRDRRHRVQDRRQFKDVVLPKAT